MISFDKNGPTALLFKRLEPVTSGYLPGVSMVLCSLKQGTEMYASEAGYHLGRTTLEPDFCAFNDSETCLARLSSCAGILGTAIVWLEKSWLSQP